jgi:hypothetical protein
MRLPSKSESRIFLIVVGLFFFIMGIVELVFDIFWWRNSKWISVYNVLIDLFGRQSIGLLWILIGVGCLAYSIVRRDVK